MFRFIIGLVLLIAGVVLLFVKYEDYQRKTKSLRAWSIPAFGLGLFFVVWSFFRVVDPGNVGIPVTFGNVGSELRPGIAFTNPLASVIEMPLRTQEYTMSSKSTEGAEDGDDSIEVKGADGATGHVDATILYRLDPAKATDVYRKIGSASNDNWTSKIIRPTSRECIRDAYADVPMIEAATLSRSRVTQKITECIEGGFTPRGFVLEDFQLRNVRVEKAVQDAINSKVAAQQAAEKKTYELQAASLDAEKRRIEAKGVADAEQIIKCGAVVVERQEDGKTVEVAEPKTGASCEDRLTPAYLQYQYIQALQALVGSPNATFLFAPLDANLTPILPLPKN